MNEGCSPAFYEFFAGAGLARKGLEPHWTCVWANDFDPKKRMVYSLNYGLDHFDPRSVTDVAPNDLPSGATMAWASFPCQDLSLAGWRRGMSARRSGTFWAFWRLMHELDRRGDRPPVIVLENVVGLLYGGNFTGLAEALAALDMQFGALVIDARRFLPQSRPRVFIVAADRHVDCARFTSPDPESVPWFPPSVLAAVRALPDELSDMWRWWRLPVPTQAPPRLEDLVDDEPVGVAWHTRQETDRLLSLMSPVNRAKVVAAIADTGRHVGMLYKRTRSGEQRSEIRFDGLAGCLRTPGGGSSRQTVVIVRNGVLRSRLLSPREAARLMGADGFKLPDNYNDAYRAMGDAVAVPVVRWLSDHLLLPLTALSASCCDGGRGGAQRHATEAQRVLRVKNRAEEWEQATAS